jgi:hypothetical protein
MAYRWKPNASQRAEYKERMTQREAVKETERINGTVHAIRKGCKVRYFSTGGHGIVEGEVVTSSYGRETNQHTFTVQDEKGTKFKVKGRNLYPNIIWHVQGQQSIEDSKL